MRFEKYLDSLHLAVTGFTPLVVFTAFVRVLLALAFIPPSIPKILHRPFTLLPPTDPVGDYFAALFRTGFYYDFLGWCQLTAAILLLLPRASHIGALLFFPIVANIMVLTISVGFKGTWVITSLMFVACLYLVCWEYPRWKSILFGDAGRRRSFSFFWYALPPAVCGVITATAILLGKAIGIGGRGWSLSFLLFVPGFLFGGAVSLHLWFIRTPAIHPEDFEDRLRS
ncbi:MAG: hypothetical protein R2684_05710 [Pyrinomonadaceae bacterium]